MKLSIILFHQFQLDSTLQVWNWICYQEGIGSTHFIETVTRWIWHSTHGNMFQKWCFSSKRQFSCLVETNRTSLVSKWPFFWHFRLISNEIHERWRPKLCVSNGGHFFVSIGKNLIEPRLKLTIFWAFLASFSIKKVTMFTITIARNRPPLSELWNRP